MCKQIKQWIHGASISKGLHKLSRKSNEIKSKKGKITALQILVLTKKEETNNQLDW